MDGRNLMQLVIPWAGQDRLFRLDTGDVMDLEQARDGEGIGAIYIRVIAFQYSVSDLFHILRIGLIGGGMKAIEAEILVRDQLSAGRFALHCETCGEILAALVEGIAPSDEQGDGDPAEAFDLADIAVRLNMKPQEIREMRFDDFINLIRAHNKRAEPKIRPPSEEEFMDILRRYEPENVT